jgi:hypothetical protein
MISAVHLLYRYLFCRKGHRIHSPFVYELITNVIGEKIPYYCYEQLNKKYLAQRERNDKLLSRREYKFFFRVANKFKPANILVIADDSGLSAMYVSAFSKRARCVVTDCSSFRDFRNEKYDLIVCHFFMQDAVYKLFECVKDDTVMIVTGIRDSVADKDLWMSVCKHSKVSVTIDLYNTGLILFSPKLHRKTYKSIIQ